MFSLKKWILKNPHWTRILYLSTILVFFTESSFHQGVFYFQAIMVVLAYGLWCRPFLILVWYGLKRKSLKKENLPLDHRHGSQRDEGDRSLKSRSHWEKTLLVNGFWLFLLIPIKLAVVDPLDLWGYDIFAWKLLFFLALVFMVFYNSMRSMESEYSPMAGAMAWSFLKSFSIMFFIPIWVVLFFPFLLTLFY